MMDPAVSGARPNATVQMLVDSLADDVLVEPFGWRRAFAGHYDLLHIHWPEHLMGGPLNVRRVGRQAALISLVALNRARRIPMVWTVHNLKPHEPVDPVRRMILAAWRGAVSSRIYLYESAASPADRKGIVIKRGDYRPLYGAGEASMPRSGLLAFGLVRRYKNLVSLIRAVGELDAATRPTLHVAGQPLDALYAAELAAEAASVAGVTLDLRDVPDAELRDLILRAELVVLPYNSVYNSGAALLALTLARPVLVPESPTMLELAAEVGAGWVQTYRGTLTGPILSSAIAASREQVDEAPDLSGRDWATAGRKHGELYRTLVAGRMPRRLDSKLGS